MSILTVAFLILSIGNISALFFAENISPIAGNDTYYFLKLVRLSILYSILFFLQRQKKYIDLISASAFLLYNEASIQNICLLLLISCFFNKKQKRTFFTIFFLLHILNNLYLSFSIFKPVNRQGFKPICTDELPQPVRKFLIKYDIINKIFYSKSDSVNVYCISRNDGGIFFELNRFCSSNIFYLIFHEAYHLLYNHTLIFNLFRMFITIFIFFQFLRRKRKISTFNLLLFFIKWVVGGNLLLNIFNMILEWRADLFYDDGRKLLRNALIEYLMVEDSLKQPNWLNIFQCIFISGHPPNNLRIKYLSN